MDVIFRRRLVEEIDTASAAERPDERLASIVERTLGGVSEELLESGRLWATAALVSLLRDGQLPAEDFVDAVATLQKAIREGSHQKIRSIPRYFWGLVRFRLRRSGLKWSMELLRRSG